MSRKLLHPATLAAQALGSTDASTGAVVLPIHTATTFLRDPDNQYRRGRGYGRADNPSYDQPQALLTALEGGAATLLFSSGMAAAAAVFQSLPRDAHVVAPRVMYWGLRSWLKNSPRLGGSRSILSMRPRSKRCATHSARTGPASYGSRPRPTRCGR
jgi:cystathionine gamma-synthase